MVKEDSGFVDKLSVSSGDAVPTAEVSESFNNNNKEFRDAISSPNKKSPANSLFPSDVSFPKNSPQLKRRNYRKRSMIDMDSDEDCDNLESTTTNDCMVDDHEDANSATAVDDDSTLEEDNIMDSYFDSEDSSDDSSDFDVHRELKYQRENDNVVPLVLLKPKPK